MLNDEKLKAFPLHFVPTEKKARRRQKRWKPLNAVQESRKMPVDILRNKIRRNLVEAARWRDQLLGHLCLNTITFNEQLGYRQSHLDVHSVSPVTDTTHKRAA